MKKKKLNKIIYIIISIVLVIAIAIGAFAINNNHTVENVYLKLQKSDYGLPNQDWLISLVDEYNIDMDNAYDIAVSSSYSGTYKDWIKLYLDNIDINTLLNNNSKSKKPLYDLMLEYGFTGSEKDAKSCFKHILSKKSLYDSCVEQGFSGDVLQLLNLISDSNNQLYNLSLSRRLFVSKSSWIASILDANKAQTGGKYSVYSVLVSCGYSDSLSKWIAKLAKESGAKDMTPVFYAVSVENGYTEGFDSWTKMLTESSDGGQSLFDTINNNNYSGKKDDLLASISSSDSVDDLQKALSKSGYTGKKDDLIDLLSGKYQDDPLTVAKNNGYDGTKEDLYKDALEIINNKKDKPSKNDKSPIKDAFISKDNHLIVEIGDEKIDLGEIEDYKDNKNIYTVTFVDYDDSVIKTQLVTEGNSAVAPANPKRDGYVFTGWNKSFENVKSNLTIKAEYKKNNSPCITISNVTANAGSKDVDVAVDISNNPGVLGMMLTLKYDDSSMTLKSIKNGSAFADVLTLTKPKSMESGCNICWDGLSISKDQVKDGTIMVLTFDIEPNAIVGKHTIELEYEKGNIVDNNLKAISFDVLSGNIEVKK